MKNKRIVFYEILTIRNYISLIISNRHAFFNSKSFSLKAFERLFRTNVYSRARRISWGELDISTGIRRNAYEAALADLKKLGSIRLDDSFHSLGKIDSNLILEKYFLDLLYEKYEYYGMASQFADESNQVEFEMHVNSLPYNLGEFRFDNKKLKVVRSLGFNKMVFVSSIVILPFYLLYFWLKNGSSNSPHFKNAIVCDVDQISTYKMFKDLFESYDNVHFVVSKQYVQYFIKGEIEKYGLHVTKLNKPGLKNIIKLPIEYLRFCVNRFHELSAFGWLFFDLVKMIVHGNLLTIDAEDSVFITFEHMSTVKAVRNELLRAKRNRSVFVCKNMYVPSVYFNVEFRYNYDILCSSGACLESIYAVQKAKTNIFLPTGTYDSHKGLVESDESRERVKRLRDFKGDSVAITILSNGIMDETYSGELRLMKLARRLSAEPNIKIFVRQKPVMPADKYFNFFVENSSSCDSIMLTHTEYKLFDFLGVTDLFVTSSSSSASDLCPAGAQFFSIDFWEDKDQFLWQTLVEGVFLWEDSAFDTIMSWVNDKPSGQRVAHRRRMQALSKLITYQFSDFETYKKNFLNLLNPYLPNIRADSNYELPVSEIDGREISCSVPD